MPFVIGSGKVQAIAKDGASQIGFWWGSCRFDWWCEGINYEMTGVRKRPFQQRGNAKQAHKGGRKK
jgi:hypothetical protein